MRKILIFPALALVLAACGPHDRCVLPPQPKLMAVADMNLDDKANALGVPPSRVPGAPRSANSYGALMSGLNDNEEAQATYQSFVDHKNAALRQQYCLENEAYKARGMKDEMSTISHAVMATCHSDDEAAVLALLLKYRNCASGNS
jgi:hypothetical protein